MSRALGFCPNLGHGAGNKSFGAAVPQQSSTNASMSLRARELPSSPPAAASMDARDKRARTAGMDRVASMAFSDDPGGSGWGLSQLIPELPVISRASAGSRS